MNTLENNSAWLTVDGKNITFGGGIVFTGCPTGILISGKTGVTIDGGSMMVYGHCPRWYDLPGWLRVIRIIRKECGR